LTIGSAPALTSTGTLRAPINLGNPILAGTDPVTGAATGVSVDPAREFCTAPYVPLELATSRTGAGRPGRLRRRAAC
jgi:polar amino acid transport system substrate-binding protein